MLSSRSTAAIADPGFGDGGLLRETPDGLRTQAARTPSPSQVAKGRIPELDGVRGIAIAMVVLHHYFGQTIQPDTPLTLFLRNIFFSGWSGVDLFFVLSGFLIGGILLDARGSPRYFGTFYARRVARIFPLYYGVLLLYVLLPLCFPSMPKYFRDGIPVVFYLVFVQNWAYTAAGHWVTSLLGMTWSLAVEEQFYAILPATVRLLSRRTLWIVCGAAVAFSAILRACLLGRGAWEGAIYFPLPCRLDSLACGVGIALATRSEQLWKWIQSRVWVVYGLLFLLLPGVLEMTGREASAHHAFGITLLCVFYSLALLVALADRASWIAGLFRVRLLQRLGRVAYGIYLLHVPVQMVLYTLLCRSEPRIAGARSVSVAFLGILVTVLVAETSWVYFERPVVDWARARYRY